MKKIIFITVALCFVSIEVFAAKTTYIVTNHRFNFIKLKEVKGRVAEERRMTHPVTVDEQGLRAALASVNLARSYIIKKEVDTQRVFDDTAIDYLAPNLVRAFSEASAGEEIVFSYLSKNPIFILRNDRLNLGQMWIHENELHIRFDKLYAKVIGDTDKRGGEAKATAESRGLRVKIEMGEGQKLGLSDPDEIVLDMHYNYVKPPEAPKIPEPVTMAGERPQIEDPAKDADSKKSAKDKDKKKGKKSEDVAAEPPAPPAPTVKERLEQLEQLKKDKLITSKDYEEKKKEILKSL